jgi:methionyl-tRNA formyltransferase
VGETAGRLGLAVLATPNVNAEDDVARVAAAAPRLLVVVAFGQLLRKPVRDVPTLGSLNLHFSLLPRWRGAAPVQRAILAGDAETGACVQRLVAKLDAGDVLAESRTQIAPSDDTPTLRGRLVDLGAPLLADVVGRLLAGEDLPATVQDEERVTLAPRLTVEDGHLDPVRESAAELDRRIRALDEWPGCRAVLVRPGRGDVPVLVRCAAPEEGAGEPGAVVSVAADGIRVGTRAGLLRLTRLQKQGKRALDCRDFLNGCPVEPGDRLAPPA